MINKHRINNLKHYTQLWLSETVCSHRNWPRPLYTVIQMYIERKRKVILDLAQNHTYYAKVHRTQISSLNPIFGFETEVNVDVKIKVIVLYSKEDMVMNIAQVNERLRQKFNHILQKKKTCHGNWYKLVFKFTPFSLRFIITN